MKLGIIADSHDRLPSLRNAITLFNKLDLAAVLHAGDFVAPFAAKLMIPSVLRHPLHCCYGNNDGERKGLKTVLPQVVDGPVHVEYAGRKIVMHHFIDWFNPADIANADVVISGHTHAVVNELRDGKLFLNPGECCGWLTNRCTVAVLDLDTLRAEIVEIEG